MKSEDRGASPNKNTDISAYLEDGCELEGNLTFSGIVRINGKFTGKITSEDGIIIGNPAQVEGILHVGSANIGGKLTGEVHAKERVEIQSTGRVEGTIISPIIVIHEGAQIVGDVKILRDMKPANKSFQEKESKVG